MITGGKCLAAAGIAGFCYWQNNGIVTTEIEYHAARLPAAFDGYRIVHLSDLHNKRFGKKQEKLLQVIRGLNPDLTVITGDLIDRYDTDISIAMELVTALVQFAPVCFVPGNHEVKSVTYTSFMQMLRLAGVKVLDDKKLSLWKNGGAISICGIMVQTPPLPRFTEISVQERLAELTQPDMGHFTLLLAHQPEWLPLYARYPVDLVLAGHAHGGQCRIPGFGGLYAPGQGVFPQYTNGVHSIRQTGMVVSRGLGNSKFLLRLFNRPEVICIALRTL